MISAAIINPSPLWLPFLNPVGTLWMGEGRASNAIFLFQQAYCGEFIPNSGKWFNATPLPLTEQESSSHDHQQHGFLGSKFHNKGSRYLHKRSAITSLWLWFPRRSFGPLQLQFMKGNRRDLYTCTQAQIQMCIFLTARLFVGGGKCTFFLFLQ